MMTKIYRFTHIILFSLLLLACAVPNPGLVVKYSTAGEQIDLKPLVQGREASWSPDGKWIAYVNSGIWITDPRVTDPQGKQRIRLTTSGHSPSWSVDGKRLAYADEGIWVLELEGRKRRRLTKEGRDPCWSADGRHIIYAADGIRAIGVPTLWVDEDNLKQLLPTVWVPEGIDPSCSPVDNKILVEIFDSKRLEFDIWLVHSSPKPKVLVANAESPAWSADGKYMLYCSTGIWVAATDGKQAQRLTVYGHQPNWSPDGSKICFSFQDHIWLMDSPYKD